MKVKSLLEKWEVLETHKKRLIAKQIRLITEMVGKSFHYGNQGEPIIVVVTEPGGYKGDCVKIKFPSGRIDWTGVKHLKEIKESVAE